MNAYTYNHALNGKAQVIFEKSTHSVSGTPNGINAEDKNGDIDVAFYPIKPVPNYNLDFLERITTEFVEHSNTKGSWNYCYNSNWSVLFTSDLILNSVDIIPSTSKTEKKLKSEQLRLENLLRARENIITGQDSVFFEHAAQIISSFTLNDVSWSTIRALKQMTNNHLFFRILMDINNPALVHNGFFDIASNMSGDLAIKLATDNNDKHFSEFRICLNNAVKEIPEAIDCKVEQDILTNILACADYSNYPTTDDHGIYDNIEINTGTLNEAFQFKKQHIVARVIQNMEVNVITSALKEEDLQLENITPLTQEQLEDNNRTLVTVMNRSSETMYEVLTDLNVFYNLF